MQRIFCIGLNKTGTLSLHEALTQLGYRSMHGGGKGVRELVDKAVQNGERLLAYVGEDYDAYSDIDAVTHGFALLDEQYPRSRFIMTVRPLEPWLDSRRRHVLRNVANRDAGRYDGRFLEVDIDAWTAEYNDHRDRVSAYFADRAGDLLEIDITEGCGWEPLCTFLGRPVPDGPFPWVNRGR